MELTAADLVASACGTKNSGNGFCHWCGSAAFRGMWPHDDDPIVQCVRSKSTALRPAEGFICAGCWMWRRKRVTVRFLRGVHAYRDGQCMAHHSWLVTEKEARALAVPEDFQLLWPILLAPPHRFALAIMDKLPENRLQLAVANDCCEIKFDTRFRFSVDGVPFSWTPYELTEALRGGDAEGKEPGVRELIRLFGPWKLPEAETRAAEQAKRKGGKGGNQDGQADYRTLKKFTRTSGIEVPG